MKAIHRIPTTQYGYIEIEQEYDNPQEAIDDHSVLIIMYKEGGGLDARTWKKVRDNLLGTGEFDSDTYYDKTNRWQRLVINQMKLSIRAHKATDPVV